MALRDPYYDVISLQAFGQMLILQMTSANGDSSVRCATVGMTGTFIQKPGDEGGGFAAAFIPPPLTKKLCHSDERVFCGQRNLIIVSVVISNQAFGTPRLILTMTIIFHCHFASSIWPNIKSTNDTFLQ
jgi:hypothetical protein